MSGQGDRDPWADPSTPTQQGAPYAGPPPTAPQPWPPGGPSPYGGVPGYPGYAGYPGQPPAWPAWGWPPPRPRRPGQVIGAAVLAFVQAALALIGTMYTYMLSSLAGLTATSGGTEFGPGLGGLAAEGNALAVVQLLSVVPLVVGGILALTRRTRTAWLTLVLALIAQVLIALYWTLRLSGAIGEGFDADAAPLVGFTLFFAAGPLVALGLVVAGPGRRWFAETPAA